MFLSIERHNFIVHNKTYRVKYNNFFGDFTLNKFIDIINKRATAFLIAQSNLRLVQ